MLKSFIIRYAECKVLKPKISFLSLRLRQKWNKQVLEPEVWADEREITYMISETTALRDKVMWTCMCVCVCVWSMFFCLSEMLSVILIITVCQYLSLTSYITITMWVCVCICVRVCRFTQFHIVRASWCLCVFRSDSQSADAEMKVEVRWKRNINLFPSTACDASCQCGFPPSLSLG